MQLVPPSNSLIENSEEKDFYWGKVLAAWKLPRHINRFVGGNPVSLERRFYNRMVDEYLISLKSDGVRYMLLLTLGKDDHEPIALMIDRKLNMYEVQVWANPKFFERTTLFDGELVCNREQKQHQQDYLVFDVIMVEGRLCTHKLYAERLQILHNTILCISHAISDADLEATVMEENKLIGRHNMYNLQIKPKRFVWKNQLDQLWADRTSYAYAQDGIIFSCNKAAIETGTQSSTIKWKPTHSVDLLVRDGAVFANSDRSDKLLLLEKVKQYAVTNDATADHEGCIVEFTLSLSETLLTCSALRTRTDKTSPNSMTTVTNTVTNVEENITIEELLGLFCDKPAA